VKEVTFLAPKERPLVEPGQIETLRNDLGLHAAEDVVCRAMEDLAQRLCHVQEMSLKGPREDLHKNLRALSAIAEQIGLAGLASVARDVIICVEYDDRVAEAATLARLARMGEGSLAMLWDYQEFSV
jgi:phytoene dehydrogenase-like protein